MNNSVTVEVSFSNVIQYQEDHPEFVKINTTMYSVTIPVATILGEGETVRIENSAQNTDQLRYEVDSSE